MALLVLTLLLASCSHLPVIKPAATPAAAQAIVEQCTRPFPRVPSRFIHTLEVVLPGGSSGMLMGITLVDPKAKTIRSAILTIEGFVLFDARLDRDIQVERAVPPFDKPSFAANLIEDVRLMYLPPQALPAQTGILEDGSAICRYTGESGTTLDVISHRDGTWEIGKYTGSEQRLRRIRASALHNGLAGEIELNGYAAWDYTLRLKLISAEEMMDGEKAPQAAPDPDEE